ncbi:hypothetical protein [uncultured Lacinutrix sp.]|uniref:hypothetical protein n=1 Tax=uncultured Lacinutrix sp. TaxID=574032 RepID=UPI00260447B9|nr:hypothetical protein [uncultured Lacinutrix sp.]
MGLFNKLFGASGDKDDVYEDDNYINTIVDHSKDEPLGISNKNLIYAGYSELGGYYYIQTYIIGQLKVKTKTGAKLHIEGDNYSFKLNSDMTELESESADRFKGYVTKIDFEIEKEAVDKISKSTIKTLTFTTKKDKVIFTKYKSQ